MKDFLPALISVLSAVIGLAIVAVLVSQRANTASVIQAGSSGFASIIGAAVGPVSNSSAFGLGGTNLFG